MNILEDLPFAKLSHAEHREAYRRYVVARHLNLRSGHTKLAENCLRSMNFIARFKKISLKERKQIDEEAKEEIARGYKELKAKKLKLAAE